MKVFKQERMVNHVPHKLKKRVLKKLGVPENHYNNSIQYYAMLDIVKGISTEAFIILKDRLRIRNVLSKKDEHGFTGRLIADFRWNETPEGQSFWSNLDKEVLAHQYDNAYHKRMGDKYEI